MADAIAELRREIHKRGFDTRKNNKGHWQVFDAQGDIVRTKKGNSIEFASTPGGGRSIANTVAMLRSAGVLPRPTEVKPRKTSTKLTRDRLKQYSDTLREELVQLMKTHDLTQSDVWHYAWYYNTQHPPLLMSSEASAQTTISRFLKGHGLSNSGYAFLSAAISAMKSLNGDIPRAAEIRTRLTASAPQPEQAKVVGIEVEGESPTRSVAPLPDLAFRTMSMIYREDKDHDAILDLVGEIARLELG
jgi:hypothetical protein